MIFTYGPPTGGSLKTAAYAHHIQMPWHEVDLLHTTPKTAVNEIMMWLARDEELIDYDEYVVHPPSLACILNVMGSRESSALGIQEAVFHLIVDLLMKVNIISGLFQRLRKANSLQFVNRTILGNRRNSWIDFYGNGLKTASNAFRIYLFELFL